MVEKYFSEKFNPKFSDTDALGHINNTRIPVWFEGARIAIFHWFTPDLDVKNWKLILAKVEINYHAQMKFGAQMEVRTYIGRIGRASFDVYQELWQSNELRASGIATMVHFDYQQQKSVLLPKEIIDKFQQILKDKN